MYDANILNSKKLFLKFNNFRYSLLLLGSKVENVKKNYELRLPFEKATEIIHRACFLLEIIQEIEKINSSIVTHFQYFKSKVQVKNNWIVFTSPSVRQYIWQIALFLNTMYLLQDRVLPLFGLALKLKGKLPNTFPNFIYRNRKMENEFLKEFPESIQTEVINYWNNNGRKLRKYRNIDQHVFDFMKRSFFFVKPKERIVVYLPDNPNAKPKNYKY